MAVLEAYSEVVKEVDISRIAVRYINRIWIPDEEVEIEDYLNCAHLCIDGLPQDYINFLSRVEYVYDVATRLIITQGRLEASVKGMACLLDLDIIRNEEPPIKCQQAYDVADALHDRAGDAFEAVITDKARRLFDAT